MLSVIVETNGAIPNREGHVATPLAQIIAQAFEFALAEPHARVIAKAVKVQFEENKVLEKGTLVAITVKTEYPPGAIHDIEALHAAIIQSISDSAMFKCRSTHGTVRLKLQFQAHREAVTT